MRRTISVFVLGLILIGKSISQTPTTWETKAPGKWDRTDVNSILYSSPWGRRLEDKKALELPGGFGSVMQRPAAAYMLRSALLVRFALVRQLQLEAKYDAMTEAAKSDFDKKNAGLLRCPQCADYYIISVRGDSPELKNATMIQGFQKSIFLSNEKGEKRILARFFPQTIPGSEALFFFPRNDEKGKALFAADNKKLRFNFALPEIERDSPMSVMRNLEINLAEIVREGTVVF